MILANKIDKRVLKKKMSMDFLEKKSDRMTISFYKYVLIDDPKVFRDQIFTEFTGMDVLGRIYIAHEGINAQISLLRNKLDDFLSFLASHDVLGGIEPNYAIDEPHYSFAKLMVKVRKKIVQDGLDENYFPYLEKVKKIDAIELNQMLAKEEIKMVDVRNHYESEVGRFENAITFQTETFRDQLKILPKELDKKKSRPLVLYCTGGIRCEKASAHLIKNGFSNVKVLKGGILNYAKKIKEKGEKSYFIGKNFVFDERLGERVTSDVIATCHQCGKSCDRHVNCKNDDCHLLFLQCLECQQKMGGCCSSNCQSIIGLPIEEQRVLRRGKKKGNCRNVFRSKSFYGGRLPKD